MPDFILTQGTAFLVMEALETTPVFRAWAAMRALQPVQVAAAPAPAEAAPAPAEPPAPPATEPAAGPRKAKKAR